MKDNLRYCLPALLVLLSALSVGATGPAWGAGTDEAVRPSNEGPYSRIISLYPAHTENLGSLGLRDEVIGVSRGEALPLEMDRKPKFSYRDDPERLLSAAPDLVLIRPMIERGYPGLVAKLRGAGVRVVSIQPRNVEEMFQYWRRLGALTGREREAEDMVRRFQQGLERISATLMAVSAEKRKGVFFEAIHSKMKTFSPDSIAVFVLRSAGGVNTAEDALTVRNTNIAAYGKERILAQADRIDVYLAQVGAMNPVNLSMILEEPGFGALKAVREGKVYLVEEEIVSRPTLGLLRGIRRIAGLLYPDHFGEVTEHTASAAPYVEMKNP